MATILQRGEDKWTEQNRCLGCNSDIEYYETDLMWVPGYSDFRESWEEKFYVHCPVCEKRKTVNTESIPNFIKIALRR